MTKAPETPALSGPMKLFMPVLVLALQVLALTLLLFAGGADDEFRLANILIAEIAVFALSLLPWHYIAASIAGSTLMFLLYYLNEYVCASRGRPLNYLDIYCIDDALKVASQYPLIMNLGIILRFLLTAAITAASCLLIKNFWFPKERPPYIRYLLSSAVIALSVGYIALFLWIGLLPVPQLVWDENKYIKSSGLLYGIFSEHHYSIVKAPEGYSENAADQILAEYASKDVPVSGIEPPTNIIVIMNEALADYSLIGETDLLADPLPGIHSLSDNVAKGRLAVNVTGGSTCNTEYEAVTGLPLAFLPTNTMPFVQYQLGASLSEAWTFTGLGYSCTPMHGYLGSEYSRKKIYAEWFENEFISGENFTDEGLQQSGFDIFDMVDNYTSIPTFGSDLEYINRFISDAECYRRIEEIMRADNESGKGSFTFTITIQNHGAYAVNTGYDRIRFADTNTDDINNYLTLISISDQSFTDFLGRLRDYPERTVVVMFGDHQPVIDFYFYKRLFSLGGNTYQTVSDNYIVPYIVWANYDINWDLPEIMSANYLLSAVKSSCGIELSAMDKLRLEAMEQYPVLTWYFAMNAEGEYVDPQEPMTLDVMKKYSMVEYYRLFDAD